MARKKQEYIKSQKHQNVMDLTEDQAREHLEKLRWPDGIRCIDCGSDQAYKLDGKSTRKGLIKCRACKAQFTVTVGTIFEDSHIPLAKWIRGFHFMTSSKKGMSALQLMRNLGLGSYKTAWHMAHRIRYAMSDPDQRKLAGQIQADTTFVGGKIRVGAGENRKSQFENKTAVVALVETDGHVRSQPIDRVDSSTLRKALEEHCEPTSQIITDDAVVFPLAVTGFSGGHETVNHSIDQYVRKIPRMDGRIDTVTTNTAEGFFSLLKRGVYGTFHHVSKQHLHRYCEEFNFRWNGRTLTDSDRRTLALMQTEGKRLMYKLPAALEGRAASDQAEPDIFPV